MPITQQLTFTYSMNTPSSFVIYTMINELLRHFIHHNKMSPIDEFLHKTFSRICYLTLIMSTLLSKCDS